MRILITAGPTREYIDSVRFITNASSGRMGYAVAAAARQMNHDVTLLTGPVSLDPPAGCTVVQFIGVDDLKGALEAHFDACDALIMTAAVGDFRPTRRQEGKISRSEGPIELTLLATEDLLAGIAARKRPSQRIIAFAVEDAPEKQAELKASKELAEKNADFVVVNPPAAMGSARTRCCILSPSRTVLPWSLRSKETLAEEILKLI